MCKLKTGAYTTRYGSYFATSSIITKNIIISVIGITGHTLCVSVGSSGIYLGYRAVTAFGEGYLCNEQRISCRIVYVYVYVCGPARIPSGEYGGKGYLPITIGGLPAAQKVHAGIIGALHIGAAILAVVAILVAVPYIYYGVLQHATIVAYIFYGNGYAQCYPGPV